MGYVSVGLLDWVRWAGYSKSCTYDVRKSEGTDVLELSAIKQSRGNISGISAGYRQSLKISHLPGSLSAMLSVDLILLGILARFP